MDRTPFAPKETEREYSRPSEESLYSVGVPKDPKGPSYENIDLQYIAIHSHIWLLIGPPATHSGYLCGRAERSSLSLNLSSNRTPLHMLPTS